MFRAIESVYKLDLLPMEVWNEIFDADEKSIHNSLLVDKLKAVLKLVK